MPLKNGPQQQPGTNWEKFRTLKDGTVLRMSKHGNEVHIEFKYKGKWLKLWGFEEAAPGEGLMDWKDYKGRTNSM